MAVHKVAGGAVSVGVDRASHTPVAKHIKRISVERAANGGYSVQHDYQHGNGQYHEPATHVFGKDEHEGVMTHIRKHLGINKVTSAARARDLMNGGKGPGAVAAKAAPDDDDDGE